MYSKYLLQWVFKNTSTLVKLLLVSINKVVFSSYGLRMTLLKKKLFQRGKKENIAQKDYFKIQDYIVFVKSNLSNSKWTGVF